jgi:putative protease
MKTGGTPFEASEIVIHEPEPSYIAISAVNNLRREALEKLSEKIKGSYKRSLENKADTYKEPQPMADNEADKNLEIYFYDKDDFLSQDAEKFIKTCEKITGSREKILALVPINQYEGCRQKALSHGIKLRPYLQAMNKGASDEELAKIFTHITKIMKEDGCGIYVGNIGQIQEFSESGIRTFGDFGLNISNHKSAEAYEFLGIEGYVPSLEIMRAFGNIPLMVAEHQLETGIIIDRKGAKYNVIFDEERHKTIIKAKDTKLDMKEIKEAYLIENKQIRIFR